MDIVSKLIVLTFFSLHQYVPAEKMREKYFNTTVDPVTLELISTDGVISLSAANQTCRALFADMQRELDMSEPEILNFFYQVIDEKSSDLVDEDSSAAIVKSTLSRICAENFTTRSFTLQEIEAVQSFIQQELLVLSTADLESLGNLRHFGKTSLYDRNGQFIDYLFSQTDNWLAYSQISPNVTKALIAAEDRSFWIHEGVDMTSMVRMAYQLKSTTSESQMSGGSTLTMQLLKNFFFLDGGSAAGDIQFTNGSLSTLLRKLREWFWAKPYQSYWDAKEPGLGKKIVLEYYLNMMNYGPGIRGIDQASEVFFKKEAGDLNIPESAFIASLFKRPNRYALPSNYESYTQARRLYVLEQMTLLTWENSLLEPITQNDFLLAEQTPLPQWEQDNSLTPTSDAAIYLELMAKNYISALDGSEDRGPIGVQIIEPELVSTIDINLQEIVRKAVLNRLDSYDNERLTRDRIEAARNDRSRFAQIESSDVSSKLSSSLTDLQTRLSEEGRKIDLVISLTSQNASRFYFHSSNTVVKTPEDLESIQNLSDRDFALGEVIAVWTNPPECQSLLDIFSPPVDDSQKALQTPIEILRLMSPCFKPIELDQIPEVQTSLVRAALIENALQAMQENSPREYMLPAFISRDGSETKLLVRTNLADSQGQLSEVRLTQEHREILSSKMRGQEISSEQMVWISKQENTDTFILQSPKLQAAAIVMDSNTGEVLAQFGGYDPQTSRFFDRSNISKRPVGSTLKPWMYYLALTKGFRPDTFIQNNGAQFRINDDSNYVPDNYDGGANSSHVTIEQALVDSINKPAVGLLTNLGFGEDRFENLREFVDFLVEIELYNASTVQYRPSIVLGAQELTVENLASSFTFFSNGEKIVKPVYFKSFRNGRGEDLQSSTGAQSTSVPFSENRRAVFDIQRMLVQVANVGTAGKLREFPAAGLGLDFCDGAAIGVSGQICFGGKTGTSSNLHDNWFIGFSRNFVIAVWVGYDSPASTGSTGGALALPIFMDIVKEGAPHLPPVAPILPRYL